MRLKCLFETVEVEGQKFAVPLGECGEGFHGVVKLSSTADEIFQLLQEETDEESIVNSLSERYDVSREVLVTDVHSIVEKLKSKGLLA